MGCCGDGSKDKVRTFDTNEFESVPDSDPIYGEPLKYDTSFKGPLNNRSCTDILCLLIFVVFLGAWAAIAVYATTNGDLNKLLVPTDTQNRKCGIDSNVLDKPYLFFFNLEKCINPLTPITGCPTPQICVEKCPDKLFVFSDNLEGKMSIPELKQNFICQTPEDLENIKTFRDAKTAIENDRCARWYVKSKNFLNRCVWDFTSSICPYIPTFLLNKRYKRSATTINGKLLLNSTLSDFSNNFNNNYNNLTAVNNLILNNNYGQFPSSLEILDQRVPVQEEPIEKCEIREKLGEEIIIRKMKQTDTYLSRLVGNLVAHFYPGEHPQEVIANRCVPDDNDSLQILINNYDLPNEIKWVVEKLKIGDDINLFGQKVVEDIVNSWVTILIALIIVMVVALIYIALMRWLAAPVIWFSILGALVGIAVGVYFSVKQYIYYRDNPNVGYHDKNIKAALKTWFEDPTAWMILAIILVVLFLIILLVVIFLRKRIVIAIALVKEGSKAVGTVISSVFFPIFPWALQVLAIGFAIAVGLYLASIGESSFKVVGDLGGECVCEAQAQSYVKGSVCNPDIFNQHCYSTQTSAYLTSFFRSNRVPCKGTGCYFEKISNPSHITYMHIYNVVGFLWLAFFISAFGEMVLAATFATWYWTFHKSDVPYFTLTKAFSRTIRYHIGTLAFGALVLTICRIIRLMLEYIDAKLKKFDNAFTRAILCCMKCFFWCLESFLRFMNRNAYIMCAIHGKNFCSSAKDAFNLLMRNFLRVVALDKVTDFLFFLSKLLLMIAAGFTTYYYVEFAFINENKLHYIGVPTTIVVLGTYLIATVFFGVYSMAVDTLFLCFLEDCERNDGSEEKPYYMSKQLMKILRKHNQLPRHHYN